MGGWAVGRAGVIISFPEHKSATLRNILMVLGRILQQVNADCRCKNDNAANLGFLIGSVSCQPAGRRLFGLLPASW